MQFCVSPINVSVYTIYLTLNDFDLIRCFTDDCETFVCEVFACTREGMYNSCFTFFEKTIKILMK